jgi:hypothetical protein
MAVLAPAHGGAAVTIEVEARLRLYPAEAVPVVQRVSAGAQGTPLLFCPAISPRVAEICRDRGVGFLDQAGNCRIPAPGLFIQISGKPTVRPDTRPAVDAFAPRSSRVVRTLLTEPSRRWQVQELAREAQVSLGLASRIKEKLLEEAFAQEQGRRLYVPDPRRLLQEWVSNYDPRREGETRLQIGVPLDVGAARLAEACKDLGVDYALTQFSGAARIDRGIAPLRTTAYIADRLKEVLRYLKWKPTEGAGNVALWTPYDESVFWQARKVGGMRVVSALQLYLDLTAAGDVGRAAAQTILREEIEPLWRR